ncbi:MAG: TetR/AcrR family transcriptional regulator [Clostridiales bacterium]|nr:TetR/AcrR family transcriptional regulator [Clostridiales bacterium]
MAAPKNENIKEKILNSASELLQLRSFSEISIADIARKAGITKGSIYYYYNSKEDLLYDIADGYLELLFHDLTVWVEDENKDTSLPRFLRYVFQRGVADPGKSLRLHLTLEAIAGNEKLREKLLGRYRMFKNILSEKLQERKPGADGEYEAWTILVMVDGLLIQSLLKNPDIDVDKFIEDTVEKLKQ